MKLIVLGGGPAGLTASLQARELHAEVTLLESKRVGGTNINEGPAPVRTLARAARLARDAGSWETFGLRGERPHIDLAAVLANAQRVAQYAHEKKHVNEYVPVSSFSKELAPHVFSTRKRSVWQMGEHGRQTRSLSLLVGMAASCQFPELNWP